MDDLSSVLSTLVLVSTIAALAPVIVALLPGPRVPQIVVLILGGIVIGPQGLGLADPAVLTLIANIGLGLVFLLAGYELDPAVFRERSGKLALTSWVITAVLAAGLVGVLATVGFVHAFVPVALGLTTTALGTLLPILREHDMVAGRLGRYILPAGAVGELLPIIGIAIFLGAGSQFVALLSLASVGVLALVLSFAPRLARGNRIKRIMKEGEHSTSQTTLRFSIVLLLFLLAVAARFGLDVVLGAFLAGMVLRRWAPGGAHALEEKLDAVGYGFFIPVFFVVSGMNLDVRSIIGAPLRLLAFLVLLLVVRGLPALVVYRKALPATERLQMMFITATSLPLLVALSEIGLRNGTMLPENAAALVGAGVLSVIFYPAFAVAIGKRSATREQAGPTSRDRPREPAAPADSSSPDERRTDPPAP
ncbi:MAG: cation:proton antiporter [Pseudonocardia sp.]|nr:cation:proton antiporter [Pseudonocardia sp.]